MRTLSDCDLHLKYEKGSFMWMGNVQGVDGGWIDNAVMIGEGGAVSWVAAHGTPRPLSRTDS